MTFALATPVTDAVKSKFLWMCVSAAHLLSQVPQNIMEAAFAGRDSGERS